MTSEILSRSLLIRDYVAQAKHRIHREPELGMKEFATTAFVRSELGKMGIETPPLDLNVGVLGIIRGEKDGPARTVALRADMDALPVSETADVPDKSVVPGVMHACGHDAHTAMLLGAAKVLSSMRDAFSGTVRLIFQPAEETLAGSQYMIEQGALGNPKADYIMGIHAISAYHVGEIALREGPSMASSDFFTVRMTGTGGHGAYPHRVGSDAVLAAANAVMAIQSIVTRQIDAIDNVVISVCEIHGGTAKNIIPATTEFSGSVRCQSPETRKSIEGRIRSVVEGIARTYLCRAELEYHYGVPPLVNAPEATAAARRSAAKIVGPEKVRHIDVPAMGSEDFSRYLEHVPQGVFARLGIGIPGAAPQLFHNGDFFFPDEALPYGTALFVQFVLDINS